MLSFLRAFDCPYAGWRPRLRPLLFRCPHSLSLLALLCSVRFDMRAVSCELRGCPLAPLTSPPCLSPSALQFFAFFGSASPYRTLLARWSLSRQCARPAGLSSSAAASVLPLPLPTPSLFPLLLAARRQKVMRGMPLFLPLVVQASAAQCPGSSPAFVHSAPFCAATSTISI